MGLYACCAQELTHDSFAATHIKNLFSNPDTYKQFSENAITHAANNFTINKEINKLQLLYSELLSN
jgi:hypothetical protein